MTDHDQDAAIGQLTKRYSEAKRTRAAALSELRGTKRILDGLSHAIDRAIAAVDLPAEDAPTLPPGFPEAASLMQTFDSLTGACHEVRLTRRLLKDAGIDVQ